MPPPPPKMLKSISDKETQIEQLLIDCGYYDTLEVFRAERSKRCRTPVDSHENVSFIEKLGDLWVCTFCEKSFTTKGSAKRHLVSTHSSDSKQFECPRCTSKFARRDDLYTHLRRMHAANQLVEAMIEEHKAELKGEHKGVGLGVLLSVVSHNEHLDVLLPSGNTICRPFSTEVSTAAAREPVKAAKACRTSKCGHWRVRHDDHEDVLVNGALHHKNDDGEWECHGELGSVEDFEFLLTSAQSPDALEVPPSCEQEHTVEQQQVHPHHHHHDHHGQHHHVHDEAAVAASCASELCFDDFAFLLDPVPGHTHHGPIPASGHFGHLPAPLPIHAQAPPQQQQPSLASVAKDSVETLLLPGGSLLHRRVTATTPRVSSVLHNNQWCGSFCEQEMTHKHGTGCGHQRMRHGNHYDYVVGSHMESDNPTCPMNGTTVLEQTDSAKLASVVLALSVPQGQELQSASSSASSGSPAGSL